MEKYEVRHSKQEVLEQIEHIIDLYARNGLQLITQEVYTAYGNWYWVLECKNDNETREIKVSADDYYNDLAEGFEQELYVLTRGMEE